MSDQDSSSRRFARVDLRARVQLTSIDPERDRDTGIPTLWDSEELCDSISEGGLFIRTADPPSTGRRVLLQIHLPGGGSVETVGRVAWTRLSVDGPCEAGVGVEFVAAAGNAKRALAAFLSRARRAPSA
jgi:Tfp pilus assembly protein PilZ